ncbi:Erythronate-4-phosphate dehydrogenase [bacterium HR20]|nr:Erythronate-4-phosphate dehydrogenase [bacterium HR20]
MIFVDRTIPLLADLLAPLEQVRSVDVRQLQRDELIASGCRALMFRSTLRVSRELVEGTPVEFLGSVTSGCDHIAPEILSDPRYRVALAAGANANAVAEYVLASILLWNAQQNIPLRRCSLGIVGFGNIGRRVAEYCHELGMEIVTNDPPLVEQGFEFPPYVRVASLTALLAESSVITVHVPLVQSGKYPTVRLLKQAQLQQSAAQLIIQTSRGGVIVERALLERSRSGVAVAVDVWEREPDVSPTLARRALLATPHIAGHSINAKLAASLKIAEQYFAFRNERFEPPPLPLPQRIRLSSIRGPEQALALLLRSRQFDADHRWLCSILPERRSERIAAIEHFRATYPERTEVFCTSYDT